MVQIIKDKWRAIQISFKSFFVNSPAEKKKFFKKTETLAIIVKRIRTDYGSLIIA